MSELPRAAGARGFAVTAGLDPEVAAPLAAHCIELGYSSLWSNDHPAGDGLRTLAALAQGLSTATDASFGLAGVALERRDPSALAAACERHGLDPAALSVAISAPTGEAGPLATLPAAARELRTALPGATLLISGPAAATAEIEDELLDGVLIEWASAALIAALRNRAEAGARRSGRLAPLLAGYVRAAVGADAETRLARDEGFYRPQPAWRSHFATLADPGRTGVARDLEADVAPAIEPYAQLLDVTVIRGLAATRLPNLERIATAAAPQPVTGSAAASLRGR